MASWILNDTPSKVFPLYSRANVGEVFPDPISPLNATTGFLANLEPGWRAAYAACQVWDHDIYDSAVEHNPIACFGGYLFINMSLMRLFGVRVPGFSPEAVDFQYFGDMPGIPSYESEARPFDESEEWSARAGGWLVNDVLGATDLESLDAERAQVRAEIAARPDLAGLSSAELAERITMWNPMFVRLFQTHIEVSLKAGIGLGALSQACAALGVPELSLTLVAGIGDVDSAAASLQMWDLGRMVAASPRLTAEFDAGLEGLWSRLQTAAGSDAGAPAGGGAGGGTSGTGDPEVVAFCAAFERFAEDWAFRGPNEWELRCPTWGTEPEMALAALDRVRLAGAGAAPAAAAARGAGARHAAAGQLRGALAGNEEVLGQLNAALHAAELWCRGRERQRTTVAMLVHEQRLAALELARRGVAAGVIERPEQIFMLLADELGDYVAALGEAEAPGAGTGPESKVGAILADREERYLALFDYEPPFVIAGTPPPLVEWVRRSQAAPAPTLAVGEAIQGVGGCPGVARGTARVVLDPSDPSALGPGDVLVAPITDPSWTPLFLPAAAVVVDVGSPFSHAAIVSRELGIPCVVSAGGATQRIPDGALVEVDGAAGTVTVIES
ncbi:MAG: rifampicin phosphotransferase [Actinomycetota bacterium]|nr:rifampicin phosphotransferase [Actinomycetota bacterium]